MAAIRSFRNYVDKMFYNSFRATAVMLLPSHETIQLQSFHFETDDHAA